jgi:hypothetical protein
MDRLDPDLLPRGQVAVEVAPGQADAHPPTMWPMPAFRVLFPVLAPERPPDGSPPRDPRT